MTDNEQIIKPTKVFMILTGFWIKPLNVNPLVKKLYSLYSVAVRISYVIFWLSLLMELIRLIIQKYETDIIMSTTLIIAATTKMQLKFVVFMRNKIAELYDIPMQEEQEVWESNDDEIKQTYSKKVKFCKYFLGAQVLVALFAVSAFNITGFIGNAKLIKHNRLYNTSLETHLMYQIYFPVNKLDHLAAYYSTMLVCTWSGFVFNCVTQMIFINLLISGAAQLEVLQIKLRKFVNIKRNPDDKTRMLKQLILKHISIIKFITTLNNRTMNIVLIEFISSSMDVATIATDFTKTETSDLGWWAIFFTLLSFQIFALTWNANEIKEQSLALADEIYKSDWYLLDKEGRQLTQIIIMRAQRPLVISIGPFGAMTSQSVLMIYKAAYSYVSVIMK